VQTFDPLEGIALAGEASRERPATTGRHTALVGMLLDEADGVEPAVDLLNPKRMPQPVNRRMLAGLAAAVRPFKTVAWLITFVGLLAALLLRRMARRDS